MDIWMEGVMDGRVGVCSAVCEAKKTPEAAAQVSVA